MPAGERLQRGVVLERALPAALPAYATPFPHAQFVLLAAEAAPDTLSALPFVRDVAMDAARRDAAATYDALYADLAPYRIAATRLAGSPVLARDASPWRLLPFVFVQACVDGRYRLSFVFHVEGPDWVGRYHAHLRPAWPAAAFARGDATLRAELRAALADAAVELRALIERAHRDALRPDGRQALIGSLHLVGHRAGGIASPERFVVRADLVEDDATSVLFRLAGDPTAPAASGGLLFGVHRLRKDQLHTFEAL
ncbi:MAG: hypothetical protein MUF30_00935 [Burkholderiales bacterium]|nr:hypothetical protein [Burkholderiales bacterium]